VETHPGVFKVTATTSKDGYKSASKSDSFTVKQATPSAGGGGGGGHNQGAKPAAVQQVKYFKEFTDMPDKKTRAERIKHANKVIRNLKESIKCRYTISF
jgi:hypothetical protein